MDSLLVLFLAQLLQEITYENQTGGDRFANRFASAGEAQLIRPVVSTIWVPRNSKAAHWLCVQRRSTALSGRLKPCDAHRNRSFKCELLDNVNEAHDLTVRDVAPAPQPGCISCNGGTGNNNRCSRFSRSAMIQTFAREKIQGPFGPP